MRTLLALFVAASLGSVLDAQCSGTWQSGGLLGGFDAPIVASVTLPNGDLVVGGSFTLADGVPCSYVARRHGSTWSAVGVPPGPVTALAVTPTGEILAAFRGGSPQLRGVVQWNGAAWTSLGVLAPTGDVTSMVVAPNGEVIASWRYLVFLSGYWWWGDAARWTGSAWTPFQGYWLGQQLTALTSDGTSVHALLADVYGQFPPRLVRWNGTSWSTEVVLPDFPWSLTALPGGDLAIGSTSVRRWNGTTLQTMPGGPSGAVFSLTTLPDGDLVAGGHFTAPGANIVRWDASTGTWSPLGSGVVGDVTHVAVDAEGGIYASGPITLAGGSAAQHVARYTSSCAFGVTTHAVGCPTSVGNAQWTIEVGPWVGATYRASCSNLPTLSVVVDALGLQTTALPLDVLLPGVGVAGCSLVVDPLILEARTVVNGTATSTLGIPDVPFLIGLPFLHQMIPFEFDAAANLVGVTGTDTLRVTMGGW